MLIRILVLVVCCAPYLSELFRGSFGERMVSHVEDYDHVRRPRVSHALLGLKAKIAEFFYQKTKNKITKKTKTTKNKLAFQLHISPLPHFFFFVLILPEKSRERDVVSTYTITLLIA
jgi:hypothetical protein